MPGCPSHAIVDLTQVANFAWHYLIVILIVKKYRRKKAHDLNGLLLIPGGSGEIRTHGGLTSSAVFKTAAFNRSATLPSLLV
jgi:hypothetical protein